MSDDNQIVTPPSFIALFVPPGRSRPNASRAEIAQRYEFCEDLASLLTETASQTRWDLGVTEDDVLLRVQRGLLTPESGVNAAEAHWVLRRLAELLDWPAAPWLLSGPTAEPDCEPDAGSDVEPAA